MTAHPNINRITMVISSLQCGGAERVVSMMANYWANAGKYITVVYFENALTNPFYALDPKVTVTPIPDPIPGSLLGKFIRLIRRILSIRATIKASTPEVIISHGEFINILTTIGLRWSTTPLILTEHSVPENDAISGIMRRMRNWAYGRARYLVVLNKDIAEYFSTRSAALISVIPNAVISSPPTSSTPVREPTVVGVGRLSHEKGFDLLIEAFSKVQASDWKLCIYGDGPCRAALETLIETLGLQGKVSLPGVSHHIHDELLKSSIFVMPSRLEGFGNALCEALNAGCAAISFDCPSGPRAIITPEVDGILVPPQDTKLLANAIQRLIDDEGLRSSLGSSGLESAKRFTQTTVMNQWDSLLANITHESTTG